MCGAQLPAQRKIFKKALLAQTRFGDWHLFTPSRAFFRLLQMWMQYPGFNSYVSAITPSKLLSYYSNPHFLFDTSHLHFKLFFSALFIYQSRISLWTNSWRVPREKIFLAFCNIPPPSFTQLCMSSPP